MTARPPVALTIAGTDSGGGAGVFADLKTFTAHGVWGTAAVVAVTAQNTVGVHRVETLSPQMVAAQIAAVATDIGVDAAKTGMLASAELVAAVVEAVALHQIGNLVVDPVAVSKHGDPLLAPDALDAVRGLLLPAATVVTPNIPEAEALAGIEIADRGGMRDGAERLLALGPRAVLLKGGHLDGPASPDLLLVAGREPVWLEGERIEGRHTHGTGCVLSAALAARLAKGEDLEDAARAAKDFVARAIGGGLELGSGVGPVNPGA